MSKIITLLLLILSATTFGQANFSYNKNIDGYWGSWDKPPYGICVYKLTGSDLYNEFIIYHAFDHPSKYIMKVTISGSVVEKNKKKKKEAIKSNTWYEYPAMVEYYTMNMSDRFKDIINEWPQNVYTTDFKKHYVPATVNIAPYKTSPEVYVIQFEGYGLGIDLRQ